MAELGMGGSSGGGAGSASGQGAIQAKVGALQSALQSLKVVINDLRQQGIGSGLIFEALSQKIGQLLQAQKGLTTELEQQKIKFKDNAEQLKVYTNLQGKLQTNIDGTVGAIKSLTKEQIDNSKRAQKASNETALKEQDAANQKKQRELSLEDVVIARYKREQALNEKVRLAYEEAEKKKAQIAKLNADEIEKREIAKFKRITDAQKQEEAESKRASKAKIEADLKAIRSGKGSAKKRLDAEIKYLQEVKKKYKEGSAEFEKLQGRISEAQGKRREASFRGGFLSGLRGQGIGKALGSLTGVGSAVAALRKIFQGLQKAITESFKASVEYEAQLAQLQAVTGVSNTELRELSRSVLDVAGSTTFTSEEIVKLQTELGKLGFSTQEIVNATEGVARTAQALGEGVAPVAQKIGQILKQYNLTANETEKISDILVSTINSSALSFEGFGTAIQYVGPLAAQVGTDFETVSSAMAVLADNGFTASRIGTGLRGIFTELSVSGRDLESAIKQLADRNISFAQAIELVGKRNAGQLISLIENVDALGDLEDKYYQVGAANIAAAQQIDTFKGNMQLLNSALNRVGISIGNFIKDSDLVKAALRIIDEEGYQTTLAMETLSNANSEVFGESLTKQARDFLGQLEINRKEINRYLTLSAYIEDGKDLAIVSRRAIVDGIVNPLAEEAVNIQNKIDSLGGSLATKKQRNELKDRLEEIREQVEFTFGSGPGGARTITVDYTKTLEGMGAAVDEVGGQIAELAKQILMDDARETIAGRFADDLERMRDLREDDLLTLEQAAALEFDARKKVFDVNELITEQEQAIADLKEEINSNIGWNGEEELAVEEAKLEALEQQKTNYQNIERTAKEMFVFAQKEYELEFRTLQNQIASEKEAMKLRQSEVKLRIETIQNQIEGEKNEEKKKQLIKDQVELQKSLLVIQNNSRETIDGYIEETRAGLLDQRKLWDDLGFDLRLLDKALERLKQFELVTQKLKIDFPELETAARGLAKSFGEQFGEQLKNGIALTPAQEQEVKDSLSSLFEKFGISEEDLSTSQRRLLEDYILSTLDVDPSKVKSKTDELLNLLLSELTDAAKAYNATALENTQNRLNQELDAIRNRYKTEEQILKSQLDNQLITESQFRTKKEELRKKQLQEENEIQKKIFDAQKKNDLINIGIETAEAVASNLLKNFATAPTPKAAVQTAIGNAIIIAGGAAKADAVRRRKFFPATFEEGGIVNGPSHSEGGVPFTVQGQGGYEMEGGEFIVNKKAAAFHRSLLERINGSVKPNTSVAQHSFAMGGLIDTAKAANIPMADSEKESVNYLKAIANATLSTASDMKKPVRAFVSSKDLTTDETSRRLRERNDRI